MENEKRLADKDEELDVQRVSNRRQIETLQENIEATETRAKNELISLRKKYQVELEEVKSKYEITKRALSDAENNSKKLQLSLKVQKKLTKNCI